MRINEAEVVPVTPSAQSKMYCYCMYAQTEESQQESQQEIEDWEESQHLGLNSIKRVHI